MILVLASVAHAGFSDFVMRQMTPKGPFSEAVPPPPPDYARPEVWSALPDVPDLADGAPEGSPAATDPRVDVFFIHSTSSVAAKWNAPADDPKLAIATDRGGVLNQGSAFNAVGAVYAPRYRQATGTAYYGPSADGERAIELAYSDIDRAFSSFLERRGSDRPFILAAHSQGAALASRLLVRRISGTPLREKMVAAWIIGSGLTEEGLAKEAPDIPPCAGPRDTGCVVAWNARSPAFQGGVEVRYAPGEHRVCANPVSEGYLGSFFPQYGDTAPRMLGVEAACEDGVLRVRVTHKPPRDLASSILDRVMGNGNYHAIEYELFYMNIRANAAERVEAWFEGSPPPSP